MFIIKLGDNDMAKNTKGFFKMEMLLLKIISEAFFEVYIKKIRSVMVIK